MWVAGLAQTALRRLLLKLRENAGEMVLARKSRGTYLMLDAVRPSNVVYPTDMRKTRTLSKNLTLRGLSTRMDLAATS